MKDPGLVLLIIVLDGLGITMIGVGVVLAHTETLEPHKALAICNLGGAALLFSIAAVHLLLMRSVGFLIGLLLSALTIAALAFGAMQTPLYRLPWINDISTDVDLPPPLSVHLPGGVPPASPAFPPAFAPQIKQAYSDLHPLLSPQAPADLLPKVAAAVRGLENVTDVRVDEAQALVHAVEITPLMRFRDDFTVRLRPEKTGTRIDVRSRSRVGKSDLGANAARIRRVLAAVEGAAR